VSITAPLRSCVLQHILQIAPLQRAVFSNLDSVEKVGGVPLHFDGVAAIKLLVGYTKAATCLELAVEETLTLFAGEFLCFTIGLSPESSAVDIVVIRWAGGNLIRWCRSTGL